MITVPRCMVLEIWSTTDRFFCHFGLFLPIYPSPPPNNLENQSCVKMKKLPQDIILQMCAINENYMMEPYR